MDIKKFKNTFSFLITKDIKKKLIIFLIISFLFLFINLFSFTLLIPFFSSMIDPNLINELSFFNKIKEFNFFENFRNEELLKLVGIFVMIMIIFSNYLLFLNEKFKFQLISSIAKSISLRFISTFVEIKFSEFLKYKKSLIVSKLLIELESVVIQIFYNFLELVSRIFIVMIIFVALLFLEPLITLISFSSIFLIFFVVYSFFKTKFKKLGHKMVEANTQRSASLNEIIVNFLSMKINNLTYFLKNKFMIATHKYYESFSSSEITKKIPKTMIEASFFSIILLISIILLSNNISTNQNLIVSFSAFALASYKIMPSVQQIFFSISTIKNSLPKLNSLSNELKKLKRSKKKINQNLRINFNEILVLSANNLTFTFNSKTIIKNLNFKIYKNTITCISGKSGSGKTTLINSILGLTRPQKGEILIFGQDPSKMNDKLISKIFSFAPQLTNLFSFNLRKNIYLNNKFFNEKFKKSLIFSNFSKNNLLNLKDLKRNLSGGEIKRLLISRSIYNDGKIIILDEPTAYLDEKSADIVIRNIQTLKNKTIIFTTHNNKLKKIADQIIRI